MTTTYEIALNEFRDASAAVRRDFGLVTSARETQIIADSQHKVASNALIASQERLARADKALNDAREAQTKAAPEHYDATGETPATHTPRVTQAEIDALGAPLTNGSIDAQAAGIGIG